MPDYLTPTDSPVSVEVDAVVTSTGDMATALQNLSNTLQGGFKTVLEEWGERVALPWIGEHWPDPRWPALAEKTIKRKQRLGQPLEALVATGAMITAVMLRGSPGNIFEVTDHSITLGVSGEAIPYAARQYYDIAGGRPWMEFDQHSDSPIPVLLQMVSDSINQSLSAPTAPPLEG
jgi:hypothetical protein